MDASRLLQQRKEKDYFFRNHDMSPLSPEQREQFDGLAYYDPNPDLDLEVTVTPFAEKKDVQIQTTTGQTRWYRRYGEFTFTVDGQQARLTIYQTPEGYFLPFADANAGGETYGAGRYLEPERGAGDTFYIDFNLAYNPFCAYSPEWTCPITPGENRLKVAVRAGEKSPEGPWVAHE